MATDTKSSRRENAERNSTKTLTLKPRAETGVVRQSFSHGRSKAVVVEKVKRRVGGPGERQSRPTRRTRAGSRSRRRAVAAWWRVARHAGSQHRSAPRRAAAEAIRRRAAHAHRGRAGPPRPRARRRQGARGRRAQDRRGRGEDPRRARRDRTHRARGRRGAQAHRGRSPPPRRRDQAQGRRGRQEALRRRGRAATAENLRSRRRSRAS
mgnify:CR=1 FL=1